MRWFETRTSVRRHVVVGCALVGMLAVGVAIGMGLTASRAEAQVRALSGDGALMFHFVKPAQAAAFEGVMAELDSALDVARGNQARGWKVFRADNDITGQGNVMYVWVIDPVRQRRRLRGVDHSRRGASGAGAGAVPDLQRVVHGRAVEAAHP